MLHADITMLHADIAPSHLSMRMNRLPCAHTADQAHTRLTITQLTMHTHSSTCATQLLTVRMVLHGVRPRLQVLHHLGRQCTEEAAAPRGRDICARRYSDRIGSASARCFSQLLCSDSQLRR